MKKTFLSGLLLFVAAVTLSNCAKDETSDLATTAQTTISATVEEPTRTALDGAAVKWVAGDKIMVANASNATAEYTLTTGAGQVNGSFTGNDLGAGAKFALYPYSATATCASGKFSFEMPATQENGNLTFGNGANPMIAQSDAKGVLNFKNVCGAIRLRLKGTQKVSKIVVSAILLAEKLSGKATVALNAEGLPVLIMDETAVNRVTLNCNNAQLDATTATSFYIVVPATTYYSGLQFMIYDETGALINSLPTTQKLTVNRSKVAKMPEKTMAATVHFPDSRFRSKLTAAPYNLILTTDGTDIDVDNTDNKAKFTSTTEISVSNCSIVSLKGIEYFTALTTLSGMNNQLTSLDLSQNTALTYLDCINNQLTSLDIDLNTKLSYLLCNNNQLTSLDISQNTELIMVHCYNNQLKGLDISACPRLNELTCGNQHADGGTGETYTKLTLICTEDQNTLITNPSGAVHNNNVVIKKSIAFPDANFRAWLQTELGCELTTDGTDIDMKSSQNGSLFAKTGSIDIFNRNIASLKGIEYFTGLETLHCQMNQLTSLDVRKNTKLTDLQCPNNQLTSLDVNQNTALTHLDCCNNQLTSLDVSKNTKLSYFLCSMNQLKSLDVSKNTALTRFECDNNQLQSLDVSKNTKLGQLYCHANQLTSLDIRTCPMLTNLACGKQHADGNTGGDSTPLKLACKESQKALTTQWGEQILNYNVVFERISAFPDANFRAWLQTNLGCQLTTDGTDIDMTVQKNKDVFATTAEIDVSNNNIVSMDGIEYFTALTHLYCNNNHLTSLDIRPLTSLSLLWCGRQLAGGATGANWSEITLYLTQTQYNAKLGEANGFWPNDKVTRIVK